MTARDPRDRLQAEPHQAGPGAPAEDAAPAPLSRRRAAARTRRISGRRRSRRPARSPCPRRPRRRSRPRACRRRIRRPGRRWAAIAERAPSRHWKTTGLSASIVSDCDASRSSSMCRRPGDVSGRPLVGLADVDEVRALGQQLGRPLGPDRHLRRVESAHGDSLAGGETRPARARPSAAKSAATVAGGVPRRAIMGRCAARPGDWRESSYRRRRSPGAAVRRRQGRRPRRRRARPPHRLGPAGPRTGRRARRLVPADRPA